MLRPSFVVASSAVLFVAMGIGRFAYTPILPLMLAHAGLTQQLAGALASANLAGYLAGALACMHPWVRVRRAALVRASIVVVILATAGMAVRSADAWLLLRFLTGIASGCAFVLGSSLLLDGAASRGARWWSAWFFAGVGLGIASTGILVPAFAYVGGWRGAWIGAAAVSLALFGVTARWLVEPGETAPHTAAIPARTPYDPRLFPWLLLAYGGSGMSYIIPATFMVAMASSTASVARYAPQTWILVGLVAAPSALLWSRIGARLGLGPTFALTLLTQGIGFVSWVVIGGAAGALIGAVTLGGTFIGVTALGANLGRALYPRRANTAIGGLTVTFGIGQIAGPLAATAIASRNGSYELAVLAAAGVAVASAAIIVAGLLVWRASRPQ